MSKRDVLNPSENVDLVVLGLSAPISLSVHALKRRVAVDKPPDVCPIESFCHCPTPMTIAYHKGMPLSIVF